MCGLCANPLSESLPAAGQAAAQNSGKPGFHMLQLSAEAEVAPL